MEIRDYMEELDRSFDPEGFDQRLWEAMQEEEFEFTDEFYDFLMENGISDVHEFLRGLRMKKQLGRK